MDLGASENGGSANETFIRLDVVPASDGPIPFPSRANIKFRPADGDGEYGSAAHEISFSEQKRQVRPARHTGSNPSFWEKAEETKILEPPTLVIHVTISCASESRHLGCFGDKRWKWILGTGSGRPDGWGDGTRLIASFR